LVFEVDIRHAFALVFFAIQQVAPECAPGGAGPLADTASSSSPQHASQKPELYSFGGADEVADVN